MDIFDILLRTTVIYLFIIIALRIFGKKELSQLSVIDLVFILLISNAVQNAMIGDNNSLVGGLAAAGTLFVVNYLLKQLFFHSERLNKFVQGNPLMLVYEGKIIKKHLDAAEISMEELEAAIREHGVDKIEDVNLAVLETDGNISILSENFHRSSKRRKAHKYISR